MRSVPITINVVSSNPIRGIRSAIQHYVIKFVSDLTPVGGVLRVFWFPLDRHDIAEILLKVEITIIIITPNTL